MELSNVLEFKGSNLRDNMKETFDLFNEIFINKENRPKLKDYFIYFETKRNVQGRELPYPEKLMHIISNDIDNELDILPCTNDVASFICNTQCKIRKANIDFHIIDRQECYFRMARIHWIPEIINLANINYPNIKLWEEVKISDRKRNKNVTKTYIRYQDKLTDYIIILRNREMNGQLNNYIFETAYPIFFERAKIQFDKGYENSLITIKQ